MMKIMPKAFALLTLTTCLPFVVRTAAGQGPESAKQEYFRYRVEFTISELEKGKAVNSRNYVMVVGLGKGQAQANGRIRVGSRVPYSTKAGEFQYSDVGMNVDCGLTPVDSDHVQADFTAESSSVASREQVTANPVFRRVSYWGRPVLVLGKPTVVSEVDDVASDHRYQIELTVTAIK